MQMILKYLGQYEEFEIVIFKEEVIKNEPIEVTTIHLRYILYIELAQMQRVDRLLLKRIPSRKVDRVCQEI